MHGEDNEAQSIRVSDGKANSHVDCMMISHAGVSGVGDSRPIRGGI